MQQARTTAATPGELAFTAYDRGALAAAVVLGWRRRQDASARRVPVTPPRGRPQP